MLAWCQAPRCSRHPHCKPPPHRADCCCVCSRAASAADQASASRCSASCCTDSSSACAEEGKKGADRAAVAPSASWQERSDHPPAGLIPATQPSGAGRKAGRQGKARQAGSTCLQLLLHRRQRRLGRRGALRRLRRLPLQLRSLGCQLLPAGQASRPPRSRPAGSAAGCKGSAPSKPAQACRRSLGGLDVAQLRAHAARRGLQLAVAPRQLHALLPDGGSHRGGGGRGGSASGSSSGGQASTTALAATGRRSQARQHPAAPSAQWHPLELA